LYTTFAYDKLTILQDSQEHGKVIRVRFHVTNTGSRRGEEIAQVYLTLSVHLGEPPKRLVGWAKLALEPGEIKQADIVIDPMSASQPLSVWNEPADQWEQVTGEFGVLVGASSRDIRLKDRFTRSA
jgi:beta-glucosidase